MIQHPEHKRLGMIRISAEAAWDILHMPRGTYPYTIDGEALFKGLLLPDEYKFVRCDALPLIECFALYVTHPDLLEIEHEKDAIRLEPTYQRQEDGTTILLEVRRY